MYKANMHEFVEKLDGYLEKNYGSHLSLGKWKSTYYIAFFPPGYTTAEAYTVFDRDDFEQQVYEYVNILLEENDLCITEM